MTYTTSSPKLVEIIEKQDLPIRDVKIAKDWSGLYFEGTVYTDAEEEAMLREKYNINY